MKIKSKISKNLKNSKNRKKWQFFFSYDTTLNVSTVLNNHLTAKVNFMKIIDEKNWKCFLDKINYYNMTHNLEKSRIKIQPKTFSLFKKKKKSPES